MEDLTMECIQIITQAGLARSSYIEAIHTAQDGDFEAAEKLMEEGNSQFQEGHKIHAGLVQKEAAGETIPVNLLLVHTEDQLLAAEQFKILSIEIIKTNRQIQNLEKEVRK